ncbi:putative ATPase [Mycobacterium kansasii 662]|uniref:Putative ATPase n=1 Tax=Mycobacterium kansasii 662 TaxID=1299326 RepID=X7XR26_MYCKA|nr:putative ATPase [Mycobacterium kansasii 662]
MNALAIDIEAAFLEYLDNVLQPGHRGRAMRRVGRSSLRRRSRPLRDVLLTGKIKETVVRLNKGTKNPVYDAIVVDAPPTGRIARASWTSPRRSPIWPRGGRCIRKPKGW